MSDSRLEKFIYAICSMDVSDLPVPLSRIEKLWNCLITGETPDFEPLSRNEKYLMAMLDRYDISNLPAPMSRGEKLLYKIAVGETDLSDVPGYLSQYEELLKYLIENGGISEGNFEYVLYTLNQSMYTLYTTAEKPVKSAILSGQTLVNVHPTDYVVAGSNPTFFLSKNIPKTMIKPNTRYFLRLYNTHQSIVRAYFKPCANNTVNLISSDNKCAIFTTKSEFGDSDFNNNKIHFYSSSELALEDIKDTKVILCEYVDGMENWDIPYFEGMQSVKMPVLTTTGSNMVNPTDIEVIGCNSYDVDSDGIVNVVGDTTGYWAKSYIRYTHHLKGNTTYYIYCNGDSTGTIKEEGWVDNINSGKISWNNFYKYTPETDVLYEVKIFLNTDASPFTCSKIRIGIFESTTKPSSFEPYKSNILTVNEEVTLRGIGDVKDELDLSTGELTQRIGEVVLDGSTISYYSETYMKELSTAVLTSKFSNCDIENPIMCNDLSTYMRHENLWEKWTSEDSGVSTVSDIWGLCIRLPHTLTGVTTADSKDTVMQKFKAYLQQNPITIQYKLATESIKTVDLTVVNQDNQPTELGTFENVTHVSLEAENLIPEVEMEVATNLLEDTVFNLTNAFNTLYPTAAKPVKSAILKGNTERIFVGKNIFDKTSKLYDGWLYANGNYCEDIGGGFYTTDFIEVKPNTDIVVNNGGGYAQYDDNKKCVYNVTYNSTTTLSNTKYIRVVFKKEAIDTLQIEYGTVSTDYEEPNCELQSVKMPVLTTTGKNLFSNEFELHENNANKLTKYKNGFIATDYIESVQAPYQIYQVKSNTQYTFSLSIPTGNGYLGISDYYSNQQLCVFYGENKKSYKSTFTTISDKIKIHMFGHKLSIGNNVELINIQLEEGDTATEYEPYKSNILMVNEDVELRGIGDVKDTLDCLTGEVVGRVGEIVLDGSEDEKWAIGGDTKENVYRYYLNKDVGMSTGYNQYGFCDKMKIILPGQNDDTEGISLGNGNKNIYVYADKTTTPSIDILRKRLSDNPITIQYPLATESVKTVDLTVVDQDNQPTELGTFDNTTHVLLNSEGLIPTAVLTVRTKIPSASSTSLLMDDISTNQQQLETTVDEQSNNVDATMVATTEIFEDTL